MIDMEVQKNQWKHISMYSRSGSWGFKNFAFLKYYNALEWESRLTFRLNNAKNTDCIEKYFKQKLHRIKFSTKNSVNAYPIYLRSRARGLQGFVIFKIYIMRRSGKVGSL